MTKLYFEAIAVECDDDRPIAFIWRDRLHRIVAVLKRWVVHADWWHQEVTRRYYKVECDDLGVYEIYWEGGGWFLERLYD